eukprot:6489229-Amphidinium_carterae.1
MQALQKPDENNPPHGHRFFMFLVHHYPHRVQYIFEKAGATADQYQRVLQHFDKRAAQVNRRTLSTIRAQTPAEVQRDLDRLHPDRFKHAPQAKIHAVPEEQEIDENYDYAET